MSNNQNILCVNCDDVIHIETCTVEVEPIVDPLVSEIEMCIAEMEHYEEMFDTTKHKLKQLKKLVKHKIKAQIVAVNN